MRSTISNLVAVLLLIGAAPGVPGALLCLGPGNHCHLEVVVGATCSDTAGPANRAAPLPRDGCPAGSRDFHLRLDSHRGDAAPMVAAPAAALLSACRVTAADFLTSPPQSWPRFIVPQSPHSMAVLRLLI